MKQESVETLRARLVAQISELNVDDWLILPRADVDRAFGPKPGRPHLPDGFCVLDDGSPNDLLILREE